MTLTCESAAACQALAAQSKQLVHDTVVFLIVLIFLIEVRLVPAVIARGESDG